MKVKIITIALFLVIMAVLPLAVVKCSDIKTNQGQTFDNNKNDYDNKELLCGLTAAIYKENYCDETIKAIAILLSTDYRADKDKFDIDDQNVCLFEKDIDNSFKETYKHIKNIVNDTNESIEYNNEIKYIPYAASSNGNTITSDKYDYLCAVASPWDCFSENFNEKSECVGVSISGIDYLCQNGMSAEDALKWYLPNFEIQKD